MIDLMIFEDGLARVSNEAHTKTTASGLEPNVGTLRMPNDLRAPVLGRVRCLFREFDVDSQRV